MTKADIVEKIHAKIGLPKKDSSALVESVLSIMKNTLETGEKIKIAGFGNFEIKQKNDRIGRNPQTGESITIEARRILSFKPSALLRQAVNK
jgi:integration host factor subunit alpha